MEINQVGISGRMALTGLRSKLAEQPYLWAYIVGTVSLLTASIAWWFTVYIGPKHVFWSMIENSLRTSSVTLKTDQSRGDSRLKQLIHVDTGAADMARSLTTLKEGDTEVKTEILGTKEADFTRYISIRSATKADVSGVKNVWARADDSAQSETQLSNHRLYAQTTLGVGLPLGSVPVPVGDVSATKRQQLLDFIRNQDVYRPDFQHVKKDYKHGRLLYTYDVTIQSILYISLMKAFAADLGLRDLEAANPNSFQDQPTIKVSLTVDALSHRLARVNFPELNYAQEYESYGLPLKAELPKQAISGTELQKRLEAISEQAKQ